MTYVVMAYMAMAYVVMANVVMTYIAMVYIVMTYIVMATCGREVPRVARPVRVWPGPFLIQLWPS